MLEIKAKFGTFLSYLIGAYLIATFLACASSKKTEVKSADIKAVAVKKTLSFEEKLANSKNKLANKVGAIKSSSIAIICKKTPHFLECHIQAFEKNFHSLKKNTQDRLLLSASLTKKLIASIPEDQIGKDEHMRLIAKSNLACVQQTPAMPPYTKETIEKCVAENWKKINLFPINTSSLEYFKTLISGNKDEKELRGFIEDHPEDLSLQCRNVIIENEIGCVLTMKSKNIQIPLPPAISQRSYKDQRKYWAKLQRMTGVVGPIGTPSGYETPIRCNLEKELMCHYKFVGGYDI